MELASTIILCVCGRLLNVDKRCAVFCSEGFYDIGVTCLGVTSVSYERGRTVDRKRTWCILPPSRILSSKLSRSTNQGTNSPTCNCFPTLFELRKIKWCKVETHYYCHKQQSQNTAHLHLHRADNINSDMRLRVKATRHDVVPSITCGQNTHVVEVGNTWSIVDSSGLFGWNVVQLCKERTSEMYKQIYQT